MILLTFQIYFIKLRSWGVRYCFHRNLVNTVSSHQTFLCIGSCTFIPLSRTFFLLLFAKLIHWNISSFSSKVITAERPHLPSDSNIISQFLYLITQFIFFVVFLTISSYLFVPLGPLFYYSVRSIRAGTLFHSLLIDSA